MAIIKCPECNKEISDKSDKCIHCGYPLGKTPYVYETINGKEFECSFLLDKSKSQAVKIKEFKELTGCDLFTAKDVVLKYHPTPKEFLTSNKTRCPKCGSTSITTGARGVNSFWGLIGASQTVNRCANCGNTWKPRG